MSKKFGYTLAEVLISIVVISIIALVAVPMIIDVVPNKNAVMIKKAYYTVDNIIKMLVNDSYYYPDMKSNCVGIDNNGNAVYNGTSGQYNCYYGLDYNTNVPLQVKSVSGTITSSTYKLAGLFASYLDTKRPFADINDNQRTLIETTDGMVYNLEGLKGSAPFTLMVDVNGKEGPNSFAPSYGKDNENDETKNKCSSFSSWVPDRAGKNFDNKKFDRIKIQIEADGTIIIPDNQEEFSSIISDLGTGK